MKVTVTVTDCPAQDARAVFEVVATVFASSDRDSGDAPQDNAGGGPTVWTTVYESDGAESTGEKPAPTSLSGPATVTVQGGPHEVARAQEALGAAFSVSDEGTAAGDQEQEVQLRVTGR
ncbi:hypothetical protein ACIQM4_10715 [Streptomyces sp. NPDC091272]|uniref:hypothetical protein n=1 Tax=Streptomyces sp. NPDC091272 TaxID=3365981 RepID=UPI0037F52EA8